VSPATPSTPAAKPAPTAASAGSTGAGTPGGTTAAAAAKPATASAPAAAPAAKSAAAPTATQVPPPANSAGMVWVNTESKVYHKPGTRYYGKTKQGKYMTEADAQKAGYRAAENE